MAEYIDREALLKFIEDTNTEREWLVSQYNADWIYSFIESAPIADVAEVKHEMWIGTEEDTSVVMCSNCRHVIDASMYLNEEPPPYCEMCGAKMDVPDIKDGNINGGNK